VICDHRDDVAAALLGALTPEEVVRVDQHVLHCDSCAQHRRELSVVRALLDTMETDEALTPPADLGPHVVAAMVALPQRRPARDFRMALLGAAAAIILAVGGFLVVRATRSTPPSSHPMQLVAPAAAPSAWATVAFHPRSTGASGTIVDLEAGDLPHSGAMFSVKVTGAGGVLGAQDFTVNNDGWAQVLLATSRPLHKGDMIEVTQRTNSGAPVTVLRCSCGL
jgi:hypothetical protein